MNDPSLSSKILALRDKAEAVCAEHIAPHREAVDRECRWPAHSLKAMADAGLMGLHVPTPLGGHNQGLSALAVITEALGRHCPSSALCYGMHCVGTAVIAAKATPDQGERYLRPIAEGRHITTLALSESGSGAHFYLPQTAMAGRNGGFIANGSKQFVTNGGFADSYVISTQSIAPDGDGDFSCLVLDRDTPGMQWQAPWAGFGMRGNASCALALNDVRIPATNILGEAGDQVWYAFEVVAPYFLVAMAGTYLGIAQAALDIAVGHVKARRYSHSGTTLADEPTVQYKIAALWSEVEKTRGLLYRAALAADLGEPGATTGIMAAKAGAGDACVTVTNEAMTRCGGIAYRENSRLSQCLRDARACHVMAPTTDLLKLWTGRVILGLPWLSRAANHKGTGYDMLLIGTGTHSDKIRQLADTAVGHGLTLTCAESTEAGLELLNSRARSGYPPRLVLIGPDAEPAVATAKSALRLAPGIHIVFTVETDQQVSLRRCIGDASLNACDRCPADIDLDQVPLCLEQLLRSPDQHRQWSNTLERFNRQIAQRRSSKPSEYRKLLVSEKYLNTLLAATPNAVLAVTPGGEIVSWNRAASVLFGLSE
jgi:alkylation response protein AidB-like acyl-CoA dehydrogenase